MLAIRAGMRSEAAPVRVRLGMRSASGSFSLRGIHLASLRIMNRLPPTNADRVFVTAEKQGYRKRIAAVMLPRSQLAREATLKAFFAVFALIAHAASSNA